MTFPLLIQHRHVHLSRQDARRLFGDHEFHKDVSLAQRGQFVAKESVGVIGKLGELSQVKILGPVREKTQVELSASDAAAIGIRVPIRHSGDLVKAGSCKLTGPLGSIRVPSCVIVCARHLHVDPKTAKKLKIKNHEVVSVASVKRPHIRLDHVLVRVHPTFFPEFHLHQDEVAELWLQSGELFSICS